MIDMFSKYDNMNKNGMVYALVCINNHIITCINYMLSIIQMEKLIKISYMLWSTINNSKNQLYEVVKSCLMS